MHQKLPRPATVMILSAVMGWNPMTILRLTRHQIALLLTYWRTDDL